MKKLALAAALAFAATSMTASAGGLAEMDPGPIIVDTATSDGGILVPIVAFILFAAVLSN